MIAPRDYIAACFADCVCSSLARYQTNFQKLSSVLVPSTHDVKMGPRLDTPEVIIQRLPMERMRAAWELCWKERRAQLYHPFSDGFGYILLLGVSRSCWSDDYENISTTLTRTHEGGGGTGWPPPRWVLHTCVCQSVP